MAAHRSGPRAWIRYLSGAAALAACAATAPAPLMAHPHVFVTASTTINIGQGAITSFDHVWTFDEMYTAMAIEGLDTNKDGKYDRQELAELAKVNMEGLKEFKYFTQAMLGTAELGFVDPKPDQFWLEVNNGILSMHFRLALEKPVLLDAKDFSVTMSDPSFFIAITLDEKAPAKIGPGAPSTCKAVVAAPQQAAADTQKLGEAFFEQLGGNRYGFMTAKAITVQC